jgi:hypothetical protein
MHFLNELPDYFIGCDPDMRNAAYAVVNRNGDLVTAFTVTSLNNVLSQSRAHKDAVQSLIPILDGSVVVAGVEGQMVYKDDKKSNPSDLIKLARSSGISCTYLTQSNVKDIQILLPSVWKGTAQKHVKQGEILRNLGQEPVLKGKGDHRYCVPKNDFLNLSMTQYKHVIDAIGIAQWMHKSYSWEFKKRGKLHG